VIFWTFKNPNAVIKQIRETGFLNNENGATSKIDRAIIDRQDKGGFPIKKNFVIGATVIWNLLFLIDILPFILGITKGFPIRYGILSALGLLFLCALLSLLSSDFRQIILKEGRELKDIKKFAIFIMLISGFMLLQLVILAKIMN